MAFARGIVWGSRALARSTGLSRWGNLRRFGEELLMHCTGSPSRVEHPPWFSNARASRGTPRTCVAWRPPLTSMLPTGRSAGLRTGRLSREAAAGGEGLHITARHGHDLAAARFGAEYVEAALAASGRRLLWVDPAEVDDDLVREVTEILTSLCARLYGRRAAADRAARAVAAVTAKESA